ncbi:endoribonuclease MazF [Fodinisporobacter ferrooxydans]|uniref:Endoribonuclease MazF n=1 Tax=Fodinisporobacter ferrooxydans TaxID=2901836 RepID=A0ABY4CQ16_9BACL|nr:endoribonuclease MazF [Alicyclobacillaceae bacterium MYW30-H2]
MVSTYIPERGDFIWLQFTPQSGHEQAGRRPAFVISPQSYNSKAGLALLCPVTSKIKGYPFEVIVPQDLPIEGAILSDQVKSLDWQSRQASFICKASEEILSEVISKLELLISSSAV